MRRAVYEHVSRRISSFQMFQEVSCCKVLLNDAGATLQYLFIASPNTVVFMRVVYVTITVPRVVRPLPIPNHIPDTPSGRMPTDAVSPPPQHGHLQLACPASVQLLSTPLNLLGMDLYNNPNSSIMARGKFIASEYTSAMLLRVSRTGPAFGIGGVGNTAFRKYFGSLFTF